MKKGNIAVLIVLVFVVAISVYLVAFGGEKTPDDPHNPVIDNNNIDQPDNVENNEEDEVIVVPVDPAKNDGKTEISLLPATKDNVNIYFNCEYDEKQNMVFFSSAVSNKSDAYYVEAFVIEPFFTFDDGQEYVLGELTFDRLKPQESQSFELDITDLFAEVGFDRTPQSYRIEIAAVD